MHHKSLEMGKEQQKSFGPLKQALMTPVVLACPDVSKGYTPYTDSSGFGVGAFLEQTDDDGNSRVYVTHADLSLGL